MISAGRQIAVDNLSLSPHQALSAIPQNSSLGVQRIVFWILLARGLLLLAQARRSLELMSGLGRRSLGSPVSKCRPVPFMILPGPIAVPAVFVAT